MTDLIAPGAAGLVPAAPGGVSRTLLPGGGGVVHIRKLGNGRRRGKVGDGVKVGERLQVEITDIDNRGKTGWVPAREEAAAEAAPAEPAPTAG